MIAKNDNFITIKEVLEMAKVSRYTLYRDIKSGKIPSVNFGRNVRIKESDAVKYAGLKEQSKNVSYYKNKDA